MQMNLCRIIAGVILLTAFLDCAAHAQSDQLKRTEGEVWFEPAKVQVGCSFCEVKT
jgi:hypothetical protein